MCLILLLGKGLPFACNLWEYFTYNHNWAIHLAPNAGILRFFFSIFHIHIVYSFVNSKPPGRKMVRKVHLAKNSSLNWIIFLIFVFHLGNCRCQCLCLSFSRCWHMCWFFGNYHVYFFWTSSTVNHFYFPTDWQTISLFFGWIPQHFKFVALLCHYK